MEHTRLPWKVDWAFPTSQSPCRILGDGEIARVTFRGKGADGNAEANAAFIVKAANNFEDMRDALKMALVQVQQDNDERIVPDNLRGTETQIRAILQRIEG